MNEQKIIWENLNEVTINYLRDTSDIPITVVNKSAVSLADWMAANRQVISDVLAEQGAILFQGFDIHEPEQFDEAFTAFCGRTEEYMNQTSPRSKVFKNVYTSTNQPSDQQILMHTENSYASTWTRFIAFCCLEPALEGGATPIADERKLIEFLKPETVNKFREKQVMYVRNLMLGAGLDWQTTFQTDDKNEVNELLRKDGVEAEWISEDHLRTRWVLPAFHEHPVTGEQVWFNHMYFYHKSHYNPEVIEYFEEENLPFTSYYGDGSEIEADVIQEINDFYANHAIVRPWNKGDVLLLDNMLYSHGRNSYKGNRKVLAAMASPVHVAIAH